MKAAVLALCLMLCAGAASAQPVDPRIRTFDYDPDRIMPIKGMLNYQMTLEFGPDERIENVSIGDALGWQVTPNRKATLLFLKPIEKAATTNMTVVTNLRRYVFDLTVAGKGEAVLSPYIVRFRYPEVAVATTIEAPPPPEAPPEERNRAYAVSGSPENRPAKVFDDGRLTYFQWGSDAAAPAIFAIDADGKETLVNSSARGPYTVVDQLAPRFVLRNGKSVASVVNQAYAGPQSVQRR